MELGIKWSWVLSGVGYYVELGIKWSWVLRGVGYYVELGIKQILQNLLMVLFYDAHFA